MRQIKSNKSAPVIPVKLVLVSVAFLASMFAFAVLAHEIVFENEDKFDYRVAEFLQSRVDGQLISFMRIITFFGSTYFLLPAYVMLVAWLFFKHQKREAINIIIIAVSSEVVLFALKATYQRIRPDLPILRSLKTYSFPSGHALSSFIFCSILAYLVWESGLRRAYKGIIISLLLVLSVLVGISRIILRMHYATDVIAGFCLGIAWVIFSFWIMKKTERAN